MFGLRRLSVLLFILQVVVAADLWAQSSEVSGRIVDASRGTVSGAKVTLTRVETGDTRSENSSAEGYYTFRFCCLEPTI
jgi:hypothetical protein